MPQYYTMLNFKQFISFLDYILMKTLTLLIATLFISLTLNYDPTVMSTCVLSCGTSTNCKTCYGLNCVECKPGYALNSSANTCTAYTCANGCATCNANGSVCYTCTDPYSIITPAGNACVQSCPLSNCAKCLAGSSSCTTCKNGYTLYSLTNQCIPSTINNCLVAYDFRSKQFQCTLCKSGFKPSNDQTLCVASTCTTITDCLTCAVTTVCTLCRDGYSVVGGNCQKNTCGVSNCHYCDNAGACLRCLSTHTLIGGQCIKNQCSLANCATCKSGSMYCDQCSIASTLNIWTRNCDLPPVSSPGKNHLVYLWFLTIPVVLIIVIVIVCIYKKVRSTQLANKTMKSSIQQSSKLPLQKQAASRQTLELSFQNLNESPTKTNIKLEPIKAPPVPKQMD